MEKFMIESPHAVEDCDRVVKDLFSAGYLHQFGWGCDDNEHTGWAIVEADSLEHAKQIVPWYVRDKARIVRLVNFEVADETHKNEE